MTTKSKKLAQTAIALAITLTFAIPLIIYHTRSPVLILTEQSFIRIYGEERIRRESFRSSLVMFRPVKTVIVANDAGDDIVQYAIAEISSRPYIVLFPLRFLRSAEIYKDHNPNIRVILLETSGYIQSDRQNDFFSYRTDLETDFYRTGIIASSLDMENNGRIAVFFEDNISSRARPAFLRALEDQNKASNAHFFSDFSSFYDISDISCVVIAGTGFEYLEEKKDIPVILFSWLNPSLAPSDIVMIIDDSPWAQAVQAVRLAETGIMTANIPS